MSEKGKLNSGLGVGAVFNQVQKTVDSKEYLVEGAKLMCVNGSCVTQLKLPKNHNYTSGGKQKVNCKDCKACVNIPYFGECKKNENTHQCEGFMDLVEKWENTAVSATKAEIVGGEEAISMSSVLLCKKGGIIIPVTSGQGYDGKINWAAFLKRYQNVVRWVSGKNMLCHVFGKDPINMNTGNYIYEKEDLVIKGTMSLSFKLFYNTMECGNQGNLGEGWSHNYGVRLIKIVGEDLLGIVLEDGREVPYRRKLGGKYAPVMGDGGSLKKSENGYFYEREEGTVYEFDCDGRLCTQRDKNGNRRIFMYNEDGFLESVGNGTGGQINYTYNKEKNLIYVEDHTGRKVSLRYQYGKLRWFINSSGCTYTYDYNENGKLNGVVTPRNIVGVKNEYDGGDRVVKQTLPDGGVVELRYDDKNNRTYMKEQNGNLIIYESDKKMRNIRTIYEDGEETFEYNDRNQLTRYVDKNGNMIKLAYDDKGNLSQIIYPDGCKHSMTYDANNRLLVLSVNGVMKIKNTYDNKGNLLHMEDALGREQEFIYDTQGRVKEVVQKDKSHIYLEYDEHSNISRIMDGSKNTTSYGYDALNRIVRTVDGNGNSTSYEYDTGDRITGVINAQGKRRIYEYTKNGKVKKIIDFNGAVISQSYNCMNMVEAYTGPDGEKFTMEYDQLQNVTRRILPNGGELAYAYDSLNRMEQIKLPTGGTIHYEYDSNGNRTAVTDPNGNRTVMGYNERNWMTKITDPSGAATRYEYDMEGHLIGITNAMGKSHTYVYDEMGQMISETDVLGNKTCYEYNELGKCICRTDPEMRQTVYEYAKGGDLSRIIYPDGTSEAYLYDNNGNLIRRQNHKGDFLEITYDCVNQPIRVKSSFGQEKSYTYNAAGKVTSIADPLGHVTHYEYSPGGKLTSVIDAAGNRTEYAYDDMGELVTICQHEGKKVLLNGEETFRGKNILDENQIHVTQYERNVLGKIKTIINPLGIKEHFTYDLAGKMTLKMDGEGYETNYTYNPQGEMEHVTYSDGRSVAFTYNSLRQLIEIQDWLGTTWIEPDEVGRAKKIIDYKGREMSYQWGKLGERKALTYPDGRTVSYEYDELIRLIRLTEGEREIYYSYDENGYLSKKIFPNGIVTSYGYNSMGQLSSLAHQQDGKILDHYEYDYDLMGNKTSIRKRRQADVFSSDGISREMSRIVQEESGFYQYQYDSMNRLTEVIKDRERISRYEYDAFGNRIRKQAGTRNIRYNYNAANQLICEEGIFPEPSYEYDDRGNLTAVLYGLEESNRYTYDETNRLAAAFNNKGQAARYNYDGLGNRIGRHEFDVSVLESDRGLQAEMLLMEQPKRETDYLLDLTRNYHNLLEKTETTGDSMGSQTYVWDNNNVLFLTEREHGYIILQDELGSTVRLTGIQDKHQTIYGYDEFGQDLYKTQGEVQPFGYTGYQSDSIANTYFAQAREYFPGIGRFAGEDIIKGTIEQPFTLNSYEYCWGNSINLVDLNGKKPEVPKKSDQILHLSINAGTGAKAKVKVLGVGAELGLLRYYTFDSLDVNEWTESMDLGGAVDVTPFLNGEVGVTGTRYASSGKHKENIVYANVQIGGIVIGTDSGEKDIILSNSIGAYLGVGGEINLDINLSAIGRKIPTTPNIVIGPVANPSNATKGESRSTDGGNKKDPTIPYIVIGPVANPSNATKCEASN